MSPRGDEPASGDASYSSHLHKLIGPGCDRSALEIRATASYNRTMSIETEELVRICESLPEDKLAEVSDFADSS